MSSELATVFCSTCRTPGFCSVQKHDSMGKVCVVSAAEECSSVGCGDKAADTATASNNALDELYMSLRLRHQLLCIIVHLLNATHPAKHSLIPCTWRVVVFWPLACTRCQHALARTSFMCNVCDAMCHIMCHILCHTSCSTHAPTCWSGAANSSPLTLCTQQIRPPSNRYKHFGTSVTALLPMLLLMLVSAAL